MIMAWIQGLIRTRAGRIAGSVAGLALTVAMLATLGAFIQHSSGEMTRLAVSTVPVDWQIEAVPGSSLPDIQGKAGDAAPIGANLPVGYAQVSGFDFAASGSVQATGPGKVVGADPSYWQAFPGQVRILSGDMSGPVLLQQTAANLHAAPGDTVTIHRPGLADTKLTISGVVDLKSADSFFQAIGVPSNAAPVAPPDNAALVPMAQWQDLFGPQAQVRPDSVRTELHVKLDPTGLPSDPAQAYQTALAQGQNFEARVAGSATLSNNLAARLGAAREDALYVRVLFLFLGVPGAVLAGLLTLAIVASGRDRRRRDESLLRLRGAPATTILGYSAIEALALGVAGCAVGLGLSELSALWLFGAGLTIASWPWLLLAACCGLLLALGGVLIPAWWAGQASSVAVGRRSLRRDGAPLWRRLYLDVVLLGLAGLVLWQTAATGYQVVLAPEGTPATSVNYWAFLAPALVWGGASLLLLRLSDLLLNKGRPLLAALLSGPGGAMSSPVAASLQRQRRRISAGIALVALAFAFGISTAVFNTTYEGQALVDAQLTNGADVTASGSTATPAGTYLDALKKIPQVTDAVAMQHRYAYVGTDLQDLYGIDPDRIAAVTNMSNAFFANGDAMATLALLKDTPSAVLVSEETVKDFQLVQGDTINLRLQGADHQYHVVPFVFAGVVREFPTAPRDSFLVANADYVAKATGVDAREVVLMRTGGDVQAAQKATEQIMAAAPGIKVTNLTQTSHLIGSSLTAVDLKGLTGFELTFAVLLVAGAAGLVLALGLADRRRSFAILTVLGAKSRALGAFIWTEGILILGLGAIAGCAVGGIVAQILVLELQGVFDPPPEVLSVPWLYIGGILLAGAVATFGAVVNGVRQAQVNPAGSIRQIQ